MPRILVSASFPESELARQTPDSSGLWEDFEFIFSPTSEPVDGWVVYDDLRQPLEQLCPPENTLLLTGEPASVRRYRNRFTSQFAQVWTAQSQIKHPYVTYRNEGQPWHYAMCSSQAHGAALGYDELRELARPVKTKLLSVICSNKQITPDQRQRIEFTRYLQSQLAGELDIFGRGWCEMTDKADAIWPYKYHIVLENDHSDHFMTEKLTDAFLGWSYPIYFGSNEAYHRFPEGSFTAIDIYQPEQSLAIIRELLDMPTYETAIPSIAIARQLVLGKYNLFAMLAHYWRENLVPRRAQMTKLLPKSHRASLVIQQLSRSLRRAA
ncbi:MAG: hypothetical protein IT422_04510 [Pirellulaceae bacterium]|nr:hypothetical protein [Pirellulaceae bacterium]